MKYECKQCGQCCKIFKGGFNFYPSKKDLECWEESAPWLLRYVKKIDGVYKAFFDPETGKLFEKCHFLKKDNEKYFCKIHDVKPSVCRDTYLDKRTAEHINCKAFD